MPDDNQDQSLVSQTPIEPTEPAESVQSPESFVPIGATAPAEPEITPEPSPEPSPESTPPPPIPEPKAEEPRPNQLKKIIPIIFVILLLAVVAGYFVFKSVLPRLAKPKQITLTYWGLWEPEEAVRGVLMEWEKTHPKVKINYSRQSPKEYRERLQSALARGEGPDIFRFHITWTPMLKNELEPLPASVMSASQFESAFYPVVSSNLRSGASYLGMPLMIDTLALFYNEDIFQAAGKAPPHTWDEVRQLATNLTIKDENGRIQTAGVALGTTSNVDHWSDILGLMMLQNGADLTNPGACSKGTSAEVGVPTEVCLGADSLTFYTLFNRVDQVWDETLPSSTMAFASGKVAMYFGPSWRVFDIKAINPSLNFKIMSVPQLPETNITWATFWVEGVAKRSQHKKEAWEFLNFLSSPQTLEKFYLAQSNLRLFGEIYPRKELAEKLRTNPTVAPFIDQAPNAQTWYLCSNTYDNGINDRMIKYFEDAVNAINRGVVAKEALMTAGQGVSQLLSQYGLGSAVAR